MPLILSKLTNVNWTVYKNTGVSRVYYLLHYIKLQYQRIKLSYNYKNITMKKMTLPHPSTIILIYKSL